MRARRALLYMPGDDRHKIEKALTLDVDCICMDLEDGVALNRKAEARRVIAAALSELDFGRSEKLVRANPVGSGLEAEDLQAVLPARPDGVVVPKGETADQLAWVGGRLEAAELTHGWRVNSIRMIAIVETARAFMNLNEIAAQPRLEALIFGAEDLAADLGAVRTPAAWEVFHARSALVMAAAAHGLQAIDMVSTDFKDLAALQEEAVFGARLGFSGKQVIHPDQVAPVQAAFTPDEAAIARARQLVAAFEEHQRRGSGAFALNGKMVDMPVIRAAKNVLERARAAGKI
jgi:citrate lyase subunit beta-like protein